MSELRKDPIVGRWVIIAENRAERPHELLEGEARRSAAEPCPFCEGNERETTGEVAAYREPGTRADGPGWRVRVVTNKFPALEMSGDTIASDCGVYRRMDGLGAHEVIVEAPNHLITTTQLSPKQLSEVLWIYRDRLLELKQDPRLLYGMIFKNVGAAAGASIEHAHSQLIVTPIVPISVAEELHGSHEYFRSQGRCAFCDMLAQESRDGRRVVLESGGFTAFCPYASSFPYETWIVPTTHASHYETLSRGEAEELAQVLRKVLAKIEAALERPAYNYIIHTAPFDTAALDHYHWHIEIIPRVTKTAGFEWGTGFYINPVPPEDAAKLMRRIETASQEAQEFPTGTTG